MKPIETGRLEAVPETRLCLEHAEKIRKHGGEFVTASSWDRTSKEGSLKRNFAGVSTKMRRNRRAVEKLKDEFWVENWKTGN
jgi:hypothetical protein